MVVIVVAVVVVVLRIFSANVLVYVCVFFTSNNIVRIVPIVVLVLMASA